MTRPVEVGDIRTTAFIGPDRSGAVVITDAVELSIDGRLVAEREPDGYGTIRT